MIRVNGEQGLPRSMHVKYFTEFLDRTAVYHSPLQVVLNADVDAQVGLI